MGARRNPALMSIVADLAELGEADVRAILDELDPTSRATLVGLIDAYRQGALPDALSIAATPPALSGWLTDRLGINDANRSTGLTPHASETLRRLAREHGWTGPASDAADAAPSRSPGARPLLARPLPARPLLTRLGLGA